MARTRILFKGSLEESGRRRSDSTIKENLARELAAALGQQLIENNLDLMLMNPCDLGIIVGNAAMAACESHGEDPRKRIRTYVHDADQEATPNFGMVLPALGGRRWEEGRIATLKEANAVVAIAGGRSTVDTLQQAQLAGLPIFPISQAGGAAKEELDRLRTNGTSLDFLAALGLGSEEIIADLVSILARLKNVDKPVSRRIFLVHGHDMGLKDAVARILTKLGMVPVVLHEQVDTGRTLFNKLQDELSDVGFALVLLTPDDFGRSKQQKDEGLKPRARQNVVFEYGWMIGALGSERVCAIVKGEVEFPSDLRGITYKTVPASQDLVHLGLQITGELKAAGYEIDANLLLSN